MFLKSYYLSLGSYVHRVQICIPTNRNLRKSHSKLRQVECKRFNSITAQQE